MEKDAINTGNETSRRETFKKAAKFVVPTLLVFNVKKAKAALSGGGILQD